MSDSLSQFRKQKDLYDYWNAVAVTDNFQQVLTYARSTIAEGGGLTPDMLAGVNLLATTLVTMIEEPNMGMPSYSTGLNHDLQPVRTVNPPAPVKPSKKK